MAAVVLVAALVVFVPAGSVVGAPVASAAPVVAIHVSELTAALESVPASAPTPMGSGTTGEQWWITSWRYFVAYQSLEEALKADGTPFVEVSDADIAAGDLLTTAGKPRYPIVISLAAEAVADNEVAALRSYVSAGGFLMAGSSSFTRTTSGASRGDFAFKAEMGLRMTTAGLQNWALNNTFTKAGSHRLTADIPSGSLFWGGKPSYDSIPWDPNAPNQDQQQSEAMNRQVWRVTNTDAQVLATGDGGVELATKGYGNGRFIYDAELQPLLGDTGYNSSAFAYTIYRNAIEWAFEAAGMPIVKVSPWQYPYDAAGVVRHDLEAYLNPGAKIRDSAAHEASLGMKGDYYFTTQTLRIGSGDTRMSDAQKRADIDALRTAVSSGATVGSHNGGLTNPNGATSGDENYLYHWGPDEALDYPGGTAYAEQSLRTSFQDIETWMSSSPYSGATSLPRLDNGRSGCGAAVTCPRTFVSPFHNAGREGSRQILQGLGAQVVGEQKVAPFPIRPFSYLAPRTYFPMVGVGVGNWYVAGEIQETVDTYLGTSLATSPNMKAAVDWYYNLGGLVNLYGHTDVAPYVEYLASKPNLWKTNAVGVRDWFVKREPVKVTPSFTRSGSTWAATATVTGSTDSQTAVELVIPSWTGTPTSVSVKLNGATAPAGTWKTTTDGLKIKVGTSVTSIEVNHGPVVTVPADITVPATGAAGAVVTFTASAVDNLGGALTPTCTPVSGSTFPVGPTTVTCTATDTTGTASKTFTITVTAPVVTPSPVVTVVPTTPVAPPATATPVPPVSGQPSPVVRLKAVSGRSKLKVDVDPNKGGKYWTFQVQRKNADGSWKALKTYRTKGSKEIRTVNLGKGTYRVWVNPKFGYQGVLSATEVTLKR